MKRIAIRLVVFLMLSAVTTVAVAWGLALWGDASILRPTQKALSANLERLQRVGWNPRQPTKYWEYVYSIHTEWGLGLSHNHVVEEAELRRSSGLSISGVFYREFHIATVTEAGWPLRCLSWSLIDPTGNGRGVIAWGNGSWDPPQNTRLGGDPIDHREVSRIEDWRRSTALELPTEIVFVSLPEKSVLPLQPIWLGLAANTAIYGIVVWIIFSILGGWKRLRRFARGRCSNCAYDLRGDYNGACSECGWKRKGA